MASVLIKPVVTQTIGGLPATITSINPTDSDCLEGTVQTVDGVKEVRWDRFGRCRDNHTDMNLDVGTNAMYDLRKTADCLGATS